MKGKPRFSLCVNILLFQACHFQQNFSKCYFPTRFCHLSPILLWLHISPLINVCNLIQVLSFPLGIYAQLLVILRMLAGSSHYKLNERITVESHLRTDSEVYIFVSISVFSKFAFDNSLWKMNIFSKLVCCSNLKVTEMVGWFIKILILL